MKDLSRIVRPNILSLKPYSSAREEYAGGDCVFLDANENPYGELNRYPDPYQSELKSILAHLKNVEQENIFVGNGSDEVIDLAFRIFCRPNIDKALTFTPSYGMYEVSAAVNNVELIKLKLNSDFQIDRIALKNQLNNELIKLIFICSPNNPTGNLIDPDDIEYLLERFGGLVLIDEAYIDFANSDSLIQKISEYENLVVIQTLSKAWGLAGARVGMAYSNSTVIGLFNKVKPPYNVSQLNQLAAVKALSNKALYDERLRLIAREKERVIQELCKLDVVVTIFPSDANFLLVKVTDCNTHYQELVTREIIVRNRNSMIQDCLRITIGTPEENNALINALKNFE